MTSPGTVLLAALLASAAPAFAAAEPDLIGPHARDLFAHQDEPDAPRDFAPQFEAPGGPQLTRRVYGYLPYWSAVDANFRWDLVSDLIVFGANLRPDGTVSSWHGWPQTSLLAAAHAHGVRVHLSVILFNTGAGEISLFLDSPRARRTAIATLVSAVANAGGDGLDYDFEVVNSAHRAAFTSFVQETHAALLAAAPTAELTLAMPANIYASGYDALSLEAATERLLLMEYDDHWSTSPTAGPVAPLTTGGFWYGSAEGGVTTFLKAGVKPGSIAMGVPYYGYEWPTQSASPGAKVIVNSSGAPTPAKVHFIGGCYPDYALHGRLWDTASQTPWALFSSNGVQHQLWCDDAISLSLRYQFVKEKELAGVMIWALGYDGARTEMWSAIEAELGAPLPAADAGTPGAGTDAGDPGAFDAGSGGQMDAGDADAGASGADGGLPDAGGADAGDPGSFDAGAHDGGDPAQGDAGAGGGSGAGSTSVPAASAGCGQAGPAPWFALFCLLALALRRRARKAG